MSSACNENTKDIMAATSIYDAYCTGAGFVRDVATAVTTTKGMVGDA